MSATSPSPSNATLMATAGFIAIKYWEMTPPARAMATPASAKNTALPAAHASPSASERPRLSRLVPTVVR